MNIAILTICTGKYTLFFEDFYKSCSEHFLNRSQKTFFVFTDGEIQNSENVLRIEQPKLGWPYDTMMRFKMFNSISEQLKKFDFIFFFNVNMFFLTDINEEVLPGEDNNFLMGVDHPGYFNYPQNLFPYERRFDSKFYIPYEIGSKYFQGCFNGGRSIEFLQMSMELERKIDEDLSIGIVPIWHDESALNWYYHNRNPLIMSPGYAYPELWELQFEKKIIQIDKNRFGGHNFLRD